jgi:ABC-type phosphate/phosphonate transport system substrate-binding protein
MIVSTALRRAARGCPLLGGILAASLTLSGPSAGAQPAKVDVLRIGTSGTISSEKEAKEKGALQSLRKFIKDESGLENETARQRDWQELADKMAKGELHLGVYQGYEFAWAQEKQPNLKPLALAVNVHRYPVVYVVTQKDNKADQLTALQGQSLAIPAEGQRLVRLFVEHEAQAAGKAPEAFFSKVASAETAEDALDDVVDGGVQAAAVDRAALEAYKRRKPGRFKQIKEVAHSQPLPPPVIAYYGDVLDAGTRQRFERGLLAAKGKEAGQTMLTLFRLTAFESAPEDFAKVLADARKTYTPPAAAAK